MAKQTTSEPVLVTGATGKQGGATVWALLARGVPVRALVREPRSAGAEALRARGVDVVRGDLLDPDSVLAACCGARAVFSIQTPNVNDMQSDAERVMGRNLVRAARAAGVPQFVHTSASAAGSHRDFPGWNEGKWDVNYWESKAYTEALVRDAGFASWTLLRPAFFMENFIRPSFLFANWVGDQLVTVLKPDTVLALVAVKDIGEVAALAICDPERFNGVSLELAAERLSMRDIARLLGDAWALPLEAPTLTPEEAIARGMLPVFVPSQQQLNEFDHIGDPEPARRAGLSLTDFKTWARQSAPGRTK